MIHPTADPEREEFEARDADHEHRNALPPEYLAAPATGTTGAVPEPSGGGSANRPITVLMCAKTLTEAANDLAEAIDQMPHAGLLKELMQVRDIARRAEALERHIEAGL